MNNSKPSRIVISGEVNVIGLTWKNNPGADRGGEFWLDAIGCKLGAMARRRRVLTEYGIGASVLPQSWAMKVLYLLRIQAPSPTMKRQVEAHFLRHPP
ncbi:MAG: hypothetical protein ACN6OP_23830 [Pseudomonadales bacterium]